MLSNIAGSSYNNLDGLSVISADEIYIGDNQVDLDNLVPYAGASKTVNLGAQNITTTHAPTAGPDLVNLATLTDAIDGQDVYNSEQFLDKLTTNSQTVAGNVEFQAVTTFGQRSFFNNGISLNASPYGTWAQVCEFTDPSFMDLVFTSGTMNEIRFRGDTGYIYSNAWSPSRAMITDLGGNLRPSSTTDVELSYLAGVTSAVQTQLNGKASTASLASYLPLAGGTMTGALAMGANKITSSTNPTVADDLTRKAYVDSAVAGAGNGIYLPLTGGTLSGTLQAINSIVSYSNTANSYVSCRTDTNTSTGLEMAMERTTNAGFLIQRENAKLAFRTNNAERLALTADGDIECTNGIIRAPFSTSLAVNRGLTVGYTAQSYTAASFTTTGVPSGLQGGTISGTYRLTAPASQAQTCMILSGFAPTAGSVWAFQFTGIVGSVALTLTVQTSSVSIISTPANYAITTTASTVSGYFVLPNIGGVPAFCFQAGVANPYVNWTGFTLYSLDTSVKGELTTANVFVNPGSYLNCGNGNGAADEANKTQIAFAYLAGSNAGRQYRHRITSEHNSGDGVTGNGNSLNFYLWSNANGVDALGTNHKMTIAGAGVGIGTLNPTARLTVNGSITIGSAYGTGVYEAGCIYADSQNGMLFRAAAAVAAADSNFRWDKSDGTELMRIRGNGNVGIGVDPLYPFHLSNTSGQAASMFIQNPTNSANQDCIVDVRTAGTSAGSPMLSLTVAGQTGWSVGCDNADSRCFKISNQTWGMNLGYKMKITSTDTLFNTNINPGTNAFVLSQVGDCRIYNGTADAYNPTSKANNLIIKSWWGCVLESYDGAVRIGFDTRTGDARFAGTLTTGNLSCPTLSVNQIVNSSGAWCAFGAYSSYDCGIYTLTAGKRHLTGSISYWVNAGVTARININFINQSTLTSYIYPHYFFMNTTGCHWAMIIDCVVPSSVPAGSYRITFSNGSLNMTADSNDYFYLTLTQFPA